MEFTVSKGRSKASARQSPPQANAQFDVRKGRVMITVIKRYQTDINQVIAALTSLMMSFRITRLERRVMTIEEATFEDEYPAQRNSSSIWNARSPFLANSEEWH